MSDHATVALLGGVNVGGNNKVPMAALRSQLAKAGFGSVQTLLASGNVLFGDHPADPARVLSDIIESEFGCSVPVVLRTLADFDAVVAGCPFDVSEVELKFLHVGFCSKMPTPDSAAAIDPDRSPPDRFVLDGDTLYVHDVNGSARSKLTAPWFDRQLDCITTFRNWRTVEKIREKLRALDTKRAGNP
jgi:uncharacterized protein (DUF1697 family)